MSYTPAQVRKAIVTGATFLVNLLTVLLAVGGILPVAVLPYVAVVLLLAGTYGVFATPNARVPGAGSIAAAPVSHGADRVSQE